MFTYYSKDRDMSQSDYNTHQMMPSDIVTADARRLFSLRARRRQGLLTSPRAGEVEKREIAASEKKGIVTKETSYHSPKLAAVIQKTHKAEDYQEQADVGNKITEKRDCVTKSQTSPDRDKHKSHSAVLSGRRVVFEKHSIETHGVRNRRKSTDEALISRHKKLRECLDYKKERWDIHNRNVSVDTERPTVSESRNGSVSYISAVTKNTSSHETRRFSLDSTTTFRKKRQTDGSYISVKENVNNSPGFRHSDNSIHSLPSAVENTAVGVVKPHVNSKISNSKPNRCNLRDGDSIKHSQTYCAENCAFSNSHNYFDPPDHTTPKSDFFVNRSPSETVSNPQICSKHCDSDFNVSSGVKPISKRKIDLEASEKNENVRKIRNLVRQNNLTELPADSIEETVRKEFVIPEVRIQPPTPTDTESESTGNDSGIKTNNIRIRNESKAEDPDVLTSHNSSDGSFNQSPTVDSELLLEGASNTEKCVKMSEDVLSRDIDATMNVPLEKEESLLSGVTEIEQSDEDNDLLNTKQREDVTEYKSEFVIDPDGNMSYYWMGLVAVTVIYNCWIIILRIAFPEMREDAVNQRMFNFLDLLCDICYLFDIFVQLRTAYLENGILVMDPVKLSRNYRGKPEFIQDMIAISPVGTVANFLARFTDSAIMDIGDIDASDVYIPIVRLPRLLKFHKLGKFFDIADSRTSNPNLLRAIKLSLYLTVVIHWIGCFYYMVSLYEGLGSNEWVYSNKIGDKNFKRKYVLCMYWAMMTLTTIGETAGPSTDLEFIFTGFTFLIGVFVFAAVVGNVGDVISNMNAARQEFQSRMDKIKFYMNHRRVPEILQNRVKRWADYSWTRTQAMDEVSMLEMLPERIRTEIAVHVHLDTLKKVKIFEECEIGLLHELVLKLRPQIYSPGDYICRTGEIGREMYIINHGKVEIIVNNASAPGGKMVVASLAEGNYFGEISLLKLDSGQNKRTADVRSVGYSELLVLSRRDLINALVEYPDAKQILEAQARLRMEKNREVRRTSTVESSGSGDGQPIRSEPKSKKNQLMQLIKSNDFQKLVKGHPQEVGKEMSELRHVIRELRSFDSQCTKFRIEQLSEKCDELKEKLQKRDVELRHALRRVKELETIILNPEERNKINKRRNSNGISIKGNRKSISLEKESLLTVESNGRRRTNKKHGSTDSSSSQNSPRDPVLPSLGETSVVYIPGISVNDVIEQEPIDVQLERYEINGSDDDFSDSETVPATPNILADLERLANDSSLFSDTSRYSDDVSSTENSSDDESTEDMLSDIL